jgi:hypothetical protein
MTALQAARQVNAVVSREDNYPAAQRIVMIDWSHNKALLSQGTRSAIRAFFEKHGRDDLCSIGYVFELGNASPSFHLCADRWTYRKACPDADGLEARWNSGGYEFPAVLLKMDELGPEWEAIAARLHKLSTKKPHVREVYDGLIQISCEVLAELARARHFGDWHALDFNVSEVSDSIELVIERDQAIRRLIEAHDG